MAYLKMGLLFTEEEMNATSITLHGFTEELDSYYLYLDGKKSRVEKPKSQLPENVDILCSKLEEEKPKYFTAIGYFLLELW